MNNNALTARLDELRRQPPRNPSEGNTGQNTPSRYSGSFMTTNQQQPTASSVVEPPGLQRRFTADMSKMAPIGPIEELNQDTEPLEAPPFVSTYTFCDRVHHNLGLRLSTFYHVLIEGFDFTRLLRSLRIIANSLSFASFRSSNKPT